MEMYFQDLNIAIPKIQKHFSKYPDASISAIYRNLRKHSSLSFFGDYPILAAITSTVLKMGIAIRHSQVKRAMRLSEELKGRRILLNQLLNPQLTTRKDAKMLYNKRNTVEMYSLSSQKGNTI